MTRRFPTFETKHAKNTDDFFRHFCSLLQDWGLKANHFKFLYYAFIFIILFVIGQDAARGSSPEGPSSKRLSIKVELENALLEVNQTKMEVEGLKHALDSKNGD